MDRNATVAKLEGEASGLEATDRDEVAAEVRDEKDVLETDSLSACANKLDRARIRDANDPVTGWYDPGRECSAIKANEWSSSASPVAMRSL
jgi:hypothetical protein